jgi:hypothetical protein
MIISAINIAHTITNAPMIFQVSSQSGAEDFMTKRRWPSLAENHGPAGRRDRCPVPGEKRKRRRSAATSGFDPQATWKGSKKPSNLVGTQSDRWRHSKAKRLGRLGVYSHLVRNSVCSPARTFSTVSARNGLSLSLRPSKVPSRPGAP